MKEVEIWKDIEGYEGLYQVSDLGRIKSLPKLVILPKGRFGKTKERIMKSRPNNKKYPAIGLRIIGMPKKGFLVHVIVAKHHVPNPDNLPEVNHIDGNKLNPAAYNLEWSTRVLNCKHSVAIGHTKSGKDSYLAKIVLDTQTGIFYECVNDAAIAKCIKYDTLKSRLSGKTRNYTSLIYA